MKKTNLLSVLIFFISISLIAQENESKKPNRTQVTFAYPIGTNGANSVEHTNKFSFNILYGLNGGVDGFEIGGVFNHNQGDVKGVQLAGVTNVNTGHSEGVLLSSVLNYSKENSKGFQAAVANIVPNEFSGVQIGVFNLAKKLDGVQLDVFNFAKENSKGFQMAVANIVPNEFAGTQIGVFNFVKDGEKVLPIGVFSIVRNGHYEFEFTGGETIYSNLNYKMGIERFYTIFKVGYSFYKSNSIYSFGIGFGKNIILSENQKISIDLSSNQVIYNNKWNGKNLLNKIDVNYKHNISEKLSFLVGPSFNVYITDEKVNGDYGTLNVPYSIYTNEWSKGKLFSWIGINAGLSLKL